MNRAWIFDEAEYTILKRSVDEYLWQLKKDALEADYDDELFYSDTIDSVQALKDKLGRC